MKWPEKLKSHALHLRALTLSNGMGYFRLIRRGFSLRQNLSIALRLLPQDKARAPLTSEKI
jgi:hypothetical protein